MFNQLLLYSDASNDGNSVLKEIIIIIIILNKNSSLTFQITRQMYMLTQRHT